MAHSLLRWRLKRWTITVLYPVLVMKSDLLQPRQESLQRRYVLPRTFAEIQHGLDHAPRHSFTRYTCFLASPIYSGYVAIQPAPSGKLDRVARLTSLPTNKEEKQKRTEKQKRKYKGQPAPPYWNPQLIFLGSFEEASRLYQPLEQSQKISSGRQEKESQSYQESYFHSISRPTIHIYPYPKL